MKHGPLLKLDDRIKADIRVLFLAKWAEGDGTPQSGDGTHAVYHAELREVLKEIGFQVEASGRMERLFEPVDDIDFIVSFMNRFGFSGSEMLAPLLSTYHQKPFFGATPILRGLGDDKHLMKLAARGRGVRTPDWMIVRRGAERIPSPAYEWTKLIVKPNASSASWGIKVTDRWDAACDHAEKLLAEGHDVIIESFISGFEIALPVVGSNGPWILPALHMDPGNDTTVRTYEQKRHLTGGTDTVSLTPIKDEHLLSILEKAALTILPEIWPHDFGRMEFKYDPETDTLNFIEINLNCNLWSKKASSVSAQTLGITHHDFVETLLVHSLRRQGLVTDAQVKTVEIP
ncbi:MAG: phosphoribosylglycinamide synthetase [Pseudomonadota bacterium]